MTFSLAPLHGPSRLSDDTNLALSTLAAGLSVEVQSFTTHCVIVVTIPLTQRPALLEAIAIYLVSAIAQTVDAALALREALFGEDDVHGEIERDVLEIIGTEGLSEEKKRDVRNPWLWEGICHLFIHLSRHNWVFHPSGYVLGKSTLKFDVHDHGLDLIEYCFW